MAFQRSRDLSEPQDPQLKEREGRFQFYVHVSFPLTAISLKTGPRSNILSANEPSFCVLIHRLIRRPEFCGRDSYEQTPEHAGHLQPRGSLCSVVAHSCPGRPSLSAAPNGPLTTLSSPAVTSDLPGQQHTQSGDSGTVPCSGGRAHREFETTPPQVCVVCFLSAELL